MLRDWIEHPREYELTTLAGAGRAVIPTAASILLFGWAFVQSQAEDAWFWDALLVIAGGIFIFVFVPAWAYTLARMFLAALEDYSRIGTTTEKVRLADYRLQGDKVMLETVQALRGMNNAQIEYALKLWDMRGLFEINGRRIAWQVGGVAVPVDFSLDWERKYLARKNNELPADHDWNTAPSPIYSREECRQYNGAIIDALVSLGYAKRPGGNLPAQLLYANHEYNQRGFETIGLDLALMIARALYDDPGKDILDVETDTNG